MTDNTAATPHRLPNVDRYPTVQAGRVVTDDGALFDAPPAPPPPPSVDRYVTEGMGQDAARTARRRALIEDGVHPATKRPVTDEGTCGDCVHLILKDGPMLGVGRGKWWKCKITLKYGRGPDIRKSWPSCAAWERREAE